MRHHIQELIDELDSRGFDWSTHQLTVKENQAIVMTNNVALIIDYTVTKNKDNTFTCQYNVNNTKAAETTRDTIEQIVDYIVE
jgi:hypothetical protein